MFSKIMKKLKILFEVESNIKEEVEDIILEEEVADSIIKNKKIEYPINE